MPRKTSLNWFMPALVKSSVGSFAGTSEELRTTLWPRSSKNFRNVLRTLSPVHFSDVVMRFGIAPVVPVIIANALGWSQRREVVAFGGRQRQQLDHRGHGERLESAEAPG